MNIRYPIYEGVYRILTLQLYGMKRDVVMAAEGLNTIVGDAFGLIQK